MTDWTQDLNPDGTVWRDERGRDSNGLVEYKRKPSWDAGTPWDYYDDCPLDPKYMSDSMRLMARRQTSDAH